MNDEFQWWLLLVGLVIGALLVFLVMADFSRSSDEQAEAELDREGDWIAGQLGASGGPVDPGLVGEILRLNREWLAGPVSPAIEPPPPPLTPPAAPPALPPAAAEPVIGSSAELRPWSHDAPDV